MLKECLARFIIGFPVGYIMVHTLWFYRGLSSAINYTYISMVSLLHSYSHLLLHSVNSLHVSLLYGIFTERDIDILIRFRFFWIYVIMTYYLDKNILILWWYGMVEQSSIHPWFHFISLQCVGKVVMNGRISYFYWYNILCVWYTISPHIA